MSDKEKKAPADKKANPSFTWDGTVNAAAAAYQGRPLRVLVLHGMGGSADTFPGAIASLTKHCGSLVEPMFAQAIHPCGGGWAWFPLDKYADWKVAWEATLASLQEFMAAHGPFDGLMGVSMGSCCAACLLSACPRDAFRFVILTCGYCPGEAHPFLMEPLSARKPFELPSLHIFSPRAQAAAPNRTNGLRVTAHSTLRCSSVHAVRRRRGRTSRDL